ncbi:MAG: NAD(+) synthase, partial [Duncaniella sp.]|nr:NAD(+) synthase [Duncaniella sp.]
MHNGFLRVAAVAPEVRVGDVGFNLDRIVEAIGLLEQQKVEFALFPEMSLTAYTCGDLFHNTALTDAASDALARLVELSAA